MDGSAARSIHDNHVLGYTVDVAARTIVIRTEYRDGPGPREFTDVHFDGVLGYSIRDSLGGILSDIYPIDIQTFLARHADQLREGAPYGWPFQGTSRDLLSWLQGHGAVAFEINSAIGFDGFVVCKAMRIETEHGDAGDELDEQMRAARSLLARYRGTLRELAD